MVSVTDWNDEDKTLSLATLKLQLWNFQVLLITSLFLISISQLFWCGMFENVSPFLKLEVKIWWFFKQIP